MATNFPPGSRPPRHVKELDAEGASRLRRRPWAIASDGCLLLPIGLIVFLLSFGEWSEIDGFPATELALANYIGIAIGGGMLFGGAWAAGRRLGCGFQCLGVTTILLAIGQSCSLSLDVVVPAPTSYIATSIAVGVLLLAVGSYLKGRSRGS